VNAQVGFCERSLEFRFSTSPKPVRLPPANGQKTTSDLRRNTVSTSCRHVGRGSFQAASSSAARWRGGRAPAASLSA